MHHLRWEKLVNPYLPNQPVTPDSFAGRADLIERIDESINAASSPLRRTTAILLHGYRGSGKTSAIRKIRSILNARVPNLVGIEIQLLASSGDEKLLALLLDNLRAHPPLAQPFWPRVRETLARVSAVTTPVGGVQLTQAQAATPTTSQALWNECINAFEGAPLIFIAIDDADKLTDPGLFFLKTVVESHSRVPLILLVAGGPSLLDRMFQRAHLSPVARIFSGAKFDIGELSREDTYEAVDAAPRVARVTDTGRNSLTPLEENRPTA
jgi:Cdc6-like AAA superfamily ATPase